ncbi:MAG: hypothetical protein INH37_24245, partial [Myxococcaceae bacterium]|nr:hypothetical protein [Myxococcaceae bacterium]
MALVAAAGWACTPGGAVGPGYRGEALFTVKGQLVTPGAPPTAPIRLAVAWYPDEAGRSAPRAIVAQEVAYEGRFPLDYGFGFFSAPPPGVLVEYRDGDDVTRAAFGVLLAYVDGDGDGQLGAIPAGARPVDRVLGTSVGDPSNGAPAEAPLWVAYVDGAPGPRWAGFAPGYNLWDGARHAVVPPDTAVPIRLDATSELAFFVCEEFITGSAVGADLPCDVEPTGGVRVIGSVMRSDGQPAASLRITDGRAPLPGLAVEVNGVAVPFDAASGFYAAAGGDLQVAAPGVNVVRVAPKGQAPLVFTVEAPGDFSLLAPLEGARVTSGSAVVAQWSRALGAATYQVAVERVTPPRGGPPPVAVPASGEAALSARLAGLVADDLHEVTVSAFSPNSLAYGRGGSLVSAYVSRSGVVDAVPADAGVWLEGVALVSRYRGQTAGGAWFEVLDGVAPVGGALVTVEGVALPFDARERRYSGALELAPGGVARVEVAVPDRPARAFEVPLPGDFSVTAPPATHPARAPLELGWTASAGATDYRVWVTDPSGRTLHVVVAAGLRATLPPLDGVGEVFVTVAA